MICNIAPHAYPLYLAVKNEDHTRTNANSPRINGIYERIHPTITEAFYDIACPNKMHRLIEALRIDLDAWLAKVCAPQPYTAGSTLAKRLC